MTDHERVYLQPLCCVDPYGGERQWCQDNVWPDSDDCEAAGVEYVRADLARAQEPTEACPVTDAMIEAGRDAAGYDQMAGFEFEKIYLAMFAAQEPTVKVDQEPSEVGVAEAMRASRYYDNDGSDKITEIVDAEVNFNALARAAIAALRTGSVG